MKLGVSTEPLPDEALVIDYKRRKAGKDEPAASHEARAWLACEKRRRNLQTMLDGAVKEQERARQHLMEHWSMRGLAHETVDGQTIHLKRKLYPKVKSKNALTDVLKKEGLTDLLTADERAFAEYVTAMEDQDQPLPASISALISDGFERFDVAVRLK